MCKRRVYIPKRNDLLDEELAKFLTNYDKRNKLRIMFLREAEGVYLFGKRRVILQLDNENKVCVKHKGNFINIAKFIEENSTEEIKNIRRINAAASFGRDKTEINPSLS